MAFLTKDTWGDAFLILRGSGGQPGRCSLGEPLAVLPTHAQLLGQRSAPLAVSPRPPPHTHLQGTQELKGSRTEEGSSEGLDLSGRNLGAFAGSLGQASTSSCALVSPSAERGPLTDDQ